MLRNVCCLTLALVFAVAVPRTMAENLVDNGDFEQGNCGFSTEYAYTMPYIGFEGSYSISVDPQIVDPAAYSYGDHTSGGGLFMIVNGAESSNKAVWSNSFPVESYATYQFEMWLSTWYIFFSKSGAVLDVLVNGELVCTAEAPSTPRVWQKTACSWNSASAKTALIEVVLSNVTNVENHFGIDDIAFLPAFRCAEILKKAVQETFVINGFARLAFKPNFGLTLQETAKRCGYHHFNWIQWCVYDDDPSRPTVAGMQPGIPYIDPPLGGWDYERICGGADFKLGYWDEDGIGCYPLERYTSTNVLEFIDKPCVSDWAYTTRFKTALAGIRNDGSATAIGSYIVWGCSSKCSGGSYARNIDLFEVEDPNIFVVGIYPISQLEPEDLDYLKSQRIGVDPLPCSYDLLGDVDNDCTVDVSDLEQVVTYWLEYDANCPPSTYPADFNDDCWIDLEDLASICRHWLVDCHIAPLSPSCILK